MAHVGKIYELAFRRDLSVNCPRNKFGWARRYKAQPGNPQGTIGSVVPSLKWQVEVEFNDDGSFSVSSDPQFVTGVPVFCRMTGKIIHTDHYDYEVREKWFRNSSELLYERILSRNSPFDYSNFLRNGHDGVVVDTPGVYFLGVTSIFASGWVAKTWTDI